MNFEHLSDEYNLERRTFVKGIGATAGTAALGLSAGIGAAHGGFHAGHANFRVQGAQKAWARGYPFEAAAVDIEPPEEVGLNVAGPRADGASVFTGGQTDLVRVIAGEFNGELAGAVEVSDRVPAGWSVDEEYGDVGETIDEDDGSTTAALGEVSTEDLDSDAATRRYFAEAPAGAGNTGTYTFGPATATAVDPTDFSGDPDREQGSTEENFGGTDSNTVVGPSTET